MKKVLLTLTAALMTLAPAAPAAVRGAVFVGRPFYGYGYGSYWAPPSYYYSNVGEVKIDTKVKNADVFINGAFAGSTHDNKTLRLRPGTYNIEIREEGRTQFNERVFVSAGKTLHLRPTL